MRLSRETVGKVIALGGTFPSHHSDRVTKWPAVWQEPPSAVVFEDEPIEIPPEAEDIVLAPEPTVVIGDSLYRATEEEAADAIAGFTISNDVTSRGEWPGYCYENEDMIDGFAYKMLPTFRPLLSQVTEVEYTELDDVEVEGYSDGTTVVSGSTNQIPFTIPELIVHVSKIVPLDENDLIALGDPGNCSEYIDEASEVTCYVEGIGELTNPVNKIS